MKDWEAKSAESILLVVVITNIISLTEYVDSIAAGVFLITWVYFEALGLKEEMRLWISVLK